MTIETKFNHQNIEKDKYKKWTGANLFYADPNSELEPFTIILPPPNVTGKLHLGHAWDGTIQDILIRYKKMNGFNACWLPGMDHAGIATQSKVDQKLKEQGVSRFDIGREEFLKEAWSWKEEYANHIRDQWSKLGLALDYSKEKFTMDIDVNKAVKQAFVKLYNDDLIYRDYRITNWDPEAKTAISDIEVNFKDVEGAEHYFCYKSVNNDQDYLEVMTTRPETMFGDGALAVHPQDNRYAHLVGQEYIIPGTKRSIRVISDEYVQMDKGSGVVKITMAHDPNDFEVAKRHQMTPRIIMDEDGKMSDNEWVPSEFIGLDRFEARKKQVKQCQDQGSLIKINPITHSVGHSERTGVVIEPLLSQQWFVKMEKLSKRSLDNQETDDKVDFIPQRFEHTFNQWMENVRDWCISRQLWWGHQIPAWYKGEEVYVGFDTPEGDGWTQDEDVLDTWFSSALWPLIMNEIKLDDQNSIDNFRPHDLLVTGYDIIFFWVSRMIFQNLYIADQKPFDQVLLHGLIRDSNGIKMSKSLGNGIDPMEVIETYGADALRFFLTTNSTPGQDLRYSEEKLESTWNFINKLWNISRYVLLNTSDIQTNQENILDYEDHFNSADYYIISKLNITVNQVKYNMDKYEFGEVAKILYDFIWEDYANWYLETTKVALKIENEIESKKTKLVLKVVLENIIKMLHPFMPFVTDEIFTNFNDVDSLLTQMWPTPINISENLNFTTIIDIIKNIRNIKAENEIKPSVEVSLIIQGELEINDYLEHIMNGMAKVSKIEVNKEDPKEEVFTRVLNDLTIHILSAGLIDVDAKINDLKLQQQNLETEIARSLDVLSNENFVKRAPIDKVELEKEKAKSYLKQYNDLLHVLNQLEVKVSSCDQAINLQLKIK